MKILLVLILSEKNTSLRSNLISKNLSPVLGSMQLALGWFEELAFLERRTFPFVVFHCGLLKKIRTGLGTVIALDLCLLIRKIGNSREIAEER